MKAAAAAEERQGRMMEVIVMPFHGQGHLNPMLQFAKRIAWKAAGSIRITVATTLSTTNKMSNSNSNIDFLTTETIYDDTHDSQLNFMARMKNFQAQASDLLDRLITNSKTRSLGKCLLVYDAGLPWALDVAKEHNILAAAFFVQNCAYVASLYPVFLEEHGEDVLHPVVAAANAKSYPPLLVELPSPEEIELSNASIQYVNSGKSDKKPIHPIIRIMVSLLANLHRADWILFNSFDLLEDEVVKWMANIWPVKTIGPTLPSAYVDKQVEYDVDYGVNLFKPNNDACMNWLNTKQAASVVYVAFGSAASLSIEQMSEIAEALKQIPSSFLWAVRETEQKNLPKNFISETSNKGLVISWCSQLDVLAHEAVGSFITHCGWNSVMEALNFGVPMLGMPQFSDHFVDAHFVDQVWGVGVRTKANEKNFVTCQEIRRCFEELMHGQRAEKIKENAAKWKALAKQAVCKGGSSDKHYDEIIDRLASS